MVTVATVVREAGTYGGGIINVARPLHNSLNLHDAESWMICGSAPSEPVRNSIVVGRYGQRVGELAPHIMGSVVHIHGLWTPFEYRAFHEARRRGARVAISPHGLLNPGALGHKRGKKKLAWWLYQKKMLQNADLLIVNSLQEKEAVLAFDLSVPVVTLPNGVDDEGLLETLSGENAHEERIVLFFSRLDPLKGIPDLIDAWTTLADRKNHSLHIYGHGESGYENYVRKLIQSAGTGSIRLFPPVFGPARWEIFKRASIFVLPSYSENFGIAVAEALTAGLPVITTSKTPWTDNLPRDCGWIVDNDVDQLRRALQTAVSLDREDRIQIGRKASAFARENFRWDRIAKKYIETYQRLESG